MDIPQFIKFSRKAMGLTQQQFGVLIGKNRLSVTSYETGRAMPSADIIFKIIELRFPQLSRLLEQHSDCTPRHLKKQEVA